MGSLDQVYAESNERIMLCLSLKLGAGTVVAGPRLE